jgi:hypothetical protein
MALDILGNAGRDKKLLKRLSKFLHDLPRDQLDLVDQISELERAIDVQLRDLSAALLSLQDLESRARKTPSQVAPNERPALHERITEVQIFCSSQLAPTLRPLALALALGQRPEAAILEALLREADAEAPVTAEHQAETWRQERSHVEVPATRVARSERELSHESREQPLAVPVSSTLVEQLRSYQQRLQHYVQGYIRCQRFSGRCDDARETLEHARAQGLRTGDWERARKFLNEMFGMINEFSPDFRDDQADFQVPFTTLEAAVREARLLVKKTAGLALVDASAEPAALVSHLTDMRDALDEIAAICATSAEETLGELRDIINQIFGEIGRQRDARRHATDHAGERVKLPMAAPAGTVALKGG